jgi:pimeloyl-ACP methyl ester carboxylesterase
MEYDKFLIGYQKASRSIRKYLFTRQGSSLLKLALKDPLPFMGEGSSLLQGHSAGGQFVHRMALLETNYLIETAVAANPGWYTVPDENYSYPCGISSLPPQTINLATAYAGNHVITLGTEDNDPNADMLYHGYCAEMQGTSRYDRGRYFYDFVRNDALNRNMPFNWKLVEVQCVAHDSSAMVESGSPPVLEVYQ